MTEAAKRRALVAAALVVATIACYRSLASARFILFDDNGYVTENTYVQRGLTAESISWAFTTGAQANWHPLTWLSHMLDVELFGIDAGKHHLVSVLLHATNATLLLFLLLRMTGAFWRSTLVAFLFALHPLHVESVAWIAERKDVLSTLFWLLTTWLWLDGIEARRPVRYLLVMAAYACGLMCKPMLVSLPATLLLLDFWPLRRGRAIGVLVREKVPLFCMSLLSCIVTLAVQGDAGAVQSLERYAFSERIANALWSYVAYLGKTLWPSGLSVFYPYPEHLGLLTVRFGASLLILAAITAVTVRLRRAAPYLIVGWLWYLVTLVPVIGLVQVGGQAMADRYTYVPLVGIFVAIAWGLGELSRWSVGRAAAVSTSTGALAALFALTTVQAGYWAGDIPLFRHALDVTTGNWLAHNNLGRGLYAEGHIDEAIAEYDRAIAISPSYADAHYNLGLAYARRARFPEALSELTRAVDLEPRFPEAHNNLGGVLVALGRPDEAIAHYREAARQDPRNAEAPYNLGNALFSQGRFDAAAEQYERALALAPGRAEAHNNLGNARVHQGRLTDAVAEYEQALRLEPGLEEARLNLAAVREALRRAR